MRDRRVLQQETLQLDKSRVLNWVIQRSALIKGAKLPGIFPMAVSLTYWPEPNATVTRFEHLSSV